MELTKEIFEVIFPQGIFEYFDLVSGTKDETDAQLTLVEKDNPPLTEENKHRPIMARKFHDITITDFPLRGRRTLLTFRRRYWKLEGQEEYLKRDIKINFPGTQLEKEFADFLKEDGGRTSGLAQFYRKVSLPPTQGI